MASIIVLTPIYNESCNLEPMIRSLACQTVRPSKVLVCDGGSTDGSAELADEILRQTGLEHEIVVLPRDPAIGKWNINNAYWSLALALTKTGFQPDFVTTIEADVTLEPPYFERLLECFSVDPLLGVACGRLEPFGLPIDCFPLGENGTMVWGANRVYSFRCWSELIGLVDLRYLPTWDSDHVVLAAIRGYHLLATPGANASVHRPINLFGGRPKAAVDASHRLPLWWAAYKALQYRDLHYLVEFSARRLSSRGMHVYKSNAYLNGLSRVYGRAAVQVLRDTLGGNSS